MRVLNVSSRNCLLPTKTSLLVASLRSTLSYTSSHLARGHGQTGICVGAKNSRSGSAAEDHKQNAFHAFLHAKNGAFLGGTHLSTLSPKEEQREPTSGCGAEKSCGGAPSATTLRSAPLSMKDFKRSSHPNPYRNKCAAESAKDLVEQLQYTAEQLNNLLRHAEKEVHCDPSENKKLNVLPSLDRRISSKVSTIHHLLSSWNSERYLQALQGCESMAVPSSSTRSMSWPPKTLPAYLPEQLTAALMRQLLNIDRVFRHIRLLSGSTGRHCGVYNNPISERIETWQHHSCVYSTLSWLIVHAIRLEVSWSSGRAPAMMECPEVQLDDPYHHLAVYHNVWRAFQCGTSLERGTIGRRSGFYDGLSFPLSPQMLSKKEQTLFQSLHQAEIQFNCSDGQRSDLQRRREQILWTSSIEEWCIRWWIQQERKMPHRGASLFGPPPISWCGTENSDQLRRLDWGGLPLTFASSALSAILRKNSFGVHSSPKFNDFAAVYVKEFVSSASYWFHHCNAERGNVASSEWIRLITLCCRAVAAFPSALQYDEVAAVARKANVSPGEVDSSPLEKLLSLLVACIPLLVRQSSKLDGETVSYLLQTFTMLGFSGDAKNVLSTSEQNIASPNVYVLLAHRAGQLADVLTADQMHRVLEAVDQVHKFSSKKIDDVDSTLRCALESAFRMRKVWRG